MFFVRTFHQFHAISCNVRTFFTKSEISYDNIVLKPKILRNIVWTLKKYRSRVVRIELNDPLRPFHRSTNCSWPLKTIESNGGTTQKPLMSMARDQKTFNGDGFLKKSWNLQCSLQTIISCILPYRFYIMVLLKTLSFLSCKHVIHCKLNLRTFYCIGFSKPKNCVTIVQLQGRITASVSMQMKVTYTAQPSSLQLIFFFVSLLTSINVLVCIRGCS